MVAFPIIPSFRYLLDKLGLGLLAHNFMNWARRDIFAGTPLARMGIREFVEQAMRVPARTEPLGMDTLITLFPETSLYAQALVQAIETQIHHLLNLIK